MLISDEPYRELAYGGVEVPFVTKYYHNAVVGYSYSKSLSVPGERIGYVVIPDEVDDSAALIGVSYDREQGDRMCECTVTGSEGDQVLH